jgi:hypothetical protein
LITDSKIKKPKNRGDASRLLYFLAIALQVFVWKNNFLSE